MREEKRKMEISELFCKLVWFNYNDDVILRDFLKILFIPSLMNEIKKGNGKFNLRF